MVEFCEIPWPSADEAARAILAAAMSDLGAAEQAVEKLTPDDFRSATTEGELGGEFYAGVFEAIRSLVGENKKPAAVLVAERMKRLGLVPKGDHDLATLLGELVYSYSAGVAIDDYCEILARYGLRRRLRMTAHKLIDLASDDTLSNAEYAAQAEALITEATATAKREKGEPKRLGTLIGERFDFHYNRKRGEITGLLTGFPDLDDQLLGLQPGDLIILAARPSMGKTALAQQILQNVAKAGKTVLLVSREMSGEQLADRAITSEGQINGGLLRAGMVPRKQLDDALAKLSQDGGLVTAGFWVDETSATVPEIRQTANRLKRAHGLDLLAVDYLQLLEPSGRRAGRSRVEDVSEMSRGLKKLAMELGIPIIALSQLSRACELREDKRPILADLRESGAIEQDADIVAFIYRDDYYHPDKYADQAVKTAEIIISKFRNGSTGTVKLGFNKELTRFVNLDKRR